MQRAPSSLSLHKSLQPVTDGRVYVTGVQRTVSLTITHEMSLWSQESDRADLGLFCPCDGISQISQPAAHPAPARQRCREQQQPHALLSSALLASELLRNRSVKQSPDTSEPSSHGYTREVTAVPHIVHSLSLLVILSTFASGVQAASHTQPQAGTQLLHKARTEGALS